MCLKFDNRTLYWEFVFSHSVLSQFSGWLGRVEAVTGWDRMFSIIPDKNTNNEVKSIFFKGKLLPKLKFKFALFFHFFREHLQKCIKSSSIIWRKDLAADVNQHLTFFSDLICPKLGSVLPDHSFRYSKKHTCSKVKSFS